MPKPREQPPTFFSIAYLAGALRLPPNTVADRFMRLVSAASGQDKTAASGQVRPPFIDRIGFVLADAKRVEDPEFHQSFQIGLVVSVLGMHSRKPTYPAGTKHVNCAMMWENGRDRQFDACVPDIIAALSQGKSVVVHCIESYHRGPIGLAAILKTLFAFDVRLVLKIIAQHRKVHWEYAIDGPIGHSLGSAVAWAVGRRMWEIPRPVAAASSQRASASASAASSQDPASVWHDPSVMSLKEASAQLEKDKGHFLYRAMMADDSDICSRHAASSQELSGLDFVDAIIRAIEKGSRESSPFLHFSWSFMEARNWHMRGKMKRGEQNGWIARISVSRLGEFADRSRAASSQERREEPCGVLGEILDVSTVSAQQGCFGILSTDSRVTSRASALNIASNQKEVLVPWRGCLPIELFERVNSDNGLPVAGIYSNKAGKQRMTNKLRGNAEKTRDTLTGARMHLLMYFHIFSAHPFCLLSFRL